MTGNWRENFRVMFTLCVKARKSGAGCCHVKEDLFKCCSYRFISLRIENVF